MVYLVILFSLMLVFDIFEGLKTNYARGLILLLRKKGLGVGGNITLNPTA
jgi:hypothetical protein